MMRRWSAIPVLSLALIAAPVAADKVDVGMRAPPWNMATADGREIFFPEDVEGQASILLFWATWCPYCKAVMPYLQKIIEDYRDHGVQVYALDFKDDGDPVAEMAERGYDFIVLPLGDLVADDYGVISAPGVLVVDADGMVVYRRRPTRAPPGKAIAEVWDEEIREALDLALGRSDEDARSGA
jgi:thiol-disulfide isomerase/thioredoxin